VKLLTEAMGGTIGVTSVLGEGTTFRLDLPNVDVATDTASVPPAAPEAPVDFDDLRAARLLVVDDNETNRELVASMFDGTHHDLRFATDGLQGVVRARDLRPDIVLMDIRMPELNGRDALERIRRLPGLGALPIIAVSASTPDSGDIELPDSFDGFLRKPFSRRALFDELARFLPRKKLRVVPPEEDRVVAATDASAVSTETQNWKALAARLREIEAREWEMVRDSLSVREARQLGEMLRAQAEAFGCPVLLKHAETLLTHCDAYAIVDLERTLAAFPDVRAEVEHSSRSHSSAGARHS
jgi:CheY-like chemotaxis protein